VTASFGVATAASGDAADLVRRADAALYRAKDAGRNKVVVDAQETPANSSQ
jgi:PleD family two-component response regulator